MCDIYGGGREGNEMIKTDSMEEVVDEMLLVLCTCTTPYNPLVNHLPHILCSTNSLKYLPTCV